MKKLLICGLMAISLALTAPTESRADGHIAQAVLIGLLVPLVWFIATNSVEIDEIKQKSENENAESPIKQ